jgi:hypothetical protein
MIMLRTATRASHAAAFLQPVIITCIMHTDSGICCCSYRMLASLPRLIIILLWARCAAHAPQMNSTSVAQQPFTPFTSSVQPSEGCPAAVQTLRLAGACVHKQVFSAKQYMQSSQLNILSKQHGCRPLPHSTTKPVQKLISSFYKCCIKCAELNSIAMAAPCTTANVQHVHSVRFCYADAC